MRYTPFLLVAFFAGVCVRADDQKPKLQVYDFWPAPDQSAYAACLDSDFVYTPAFEQGFAETRVILLVVRSLQKPVFYRVTSPRFSEAYWSPDSRQCVITDAPTNAGPEMWLITKAKKSAWIVREFDPFDELDERYYQKVDPHAMTLTRDYYEKFRWLDNRRFTFTIVHRLGDYRAEIDSTSKTLKPKLSKTSEPRESPAAN